MVLVVRAEPELEQQLDRLARQLLARLEPPHWREQVPGWSDWTA